MDDPCNEQFERIEAWGFWATFVLFFALFSALIYVGIRLW